MRSIFCPVWVRHHLSFAKSLGIPEQYENVNMENLTEIIQEEIIERLDLSYSRYTVPEDSQYIIPLQT